MDLRGKRVLVFGDSLTHRGSRTAPDAREVTEGVDRTSGAPGDLLASHLLQLGAAAARINGRVSRSAYNFFRIEDATDILAEEVAWKPDLVFVFLGTNDLGLNAAKDAAAFEALRQPFADAGAEVWAIGPPAFAKDTARAQAKVVYKTLAKVFGRDRVLDLRPLSQDAARTDDGVHFTAQGAAQVAAALADRIEAEGRLAAISPWRRVGVAGAVASGFVVLAWLIRRRRM